MQFDFTFTGPPFFDQTNQLHSSLFFTDFPSTAPAVFHHPPYFRFHLPNVASSSRALYGGTAHGMSIPTNMSCTDSENVASISASSSPTDSVISSDMQHPAVAPESVHVVCNAPLVAPVPLPYHSPTFLQFDLPDDDEDLSHPPYVFRPHKRKREDEDTDSNKFVIMKRRAATDGDRSSRRPPGVGVYPSTQRPPLRPYATPMTAPKQYKHR
ncbi:hypothetical protein PHLCEN_2v4558 [Hermanssonia centrifuga]|uniref:Uncharacterized protein n=1 Tax=Hermanssonia centrifuga TaxID=98765 RepID=A0A2R6PNH3_9APHY|nr:hypothetical protein PHLCEN_2v4558 [Hermanssonia centrifuga]